MCGINGLIQWRMADDISRAELHRLVSEMNDQIIYRGPDDEGVFVQNNVGIGMRRLSILDLATGHQPMISSDGNVAIVFNGEIYNYQRIKATLKAKDYTFITTSDTEVILNGYIDCGIDIFSKIQGMFALAIYDMKHQKIILARDRTGEKPLHYYADEECFIFGSEIKSLLATKRIQKSISRSALEQFLKLTYVPAPLTIFENIHKLPAGHYMEIRMDGTIEEHQYWDVEYNKTNLIWDFDECKRGLRDRIYQAVEECMICDVPFGTFLSGGIDSNIITGVMSRISNQKIDTFTIGFQNKDYDESNLAAIAAKFHHTRHHVFCLDYENVLDRLDQYLATMDEPLADPAYLPTYLLSQFAKGYVSVALTGDAGDELFGGYERYLIGYYANLYQKIPTLIRKQIIEKIVANLHVGDRRMRKINKVLRYADQDLQAQRKILMQHGFADEELKKLLMNVGTLDPLACLDDAYNKYACQSDEISCTLYMDLKVELEGCMLCKVDRASMASSLETRTPMLRSEVIEYAARIPSKFKINHRDKKIILKETFQDLLPPELSHAPKHGFEVPLSDWFRKGLSSNLMMKMNKNEVERQGLFHYEYIQELVQKHQIGEIDNSRKLWCLYVFQTWYERYFN